MTTYQKLYETYYIDYSRGLMTWGEFKEAVKSLNRRIPCDTTPNSH